MICLNLLLRQLLYFSVFPIFRQVEWLYKPSKNCKYQNFNHCLQIGLSFVWNCGKMIILLYPLLSWLYKYYLCYFCHGLLLGAHVELFNQSEFQCQGPFLSPSFPEHNPLPLLISFQFLHYRVQSTLIGFILLNVWWKTSFNWMGTSYGRHWSFELICLSTFNNIANLLNLILCLLLGHCWKHKFVLRPAPITELAWSSPLNRLLNGNTTVLATFWGDFICNPSANCFWYCIVFI